jgi:hypothetical protein
MNSKAALVVIATLLVPVLSVLTQGNNMQLFLNEHNIHLSAVDIALVSSLLVGILNLYKSPPGSK